MVVSATSFAQTQKRVAVLPVDVPPGLSDVDPARLSEQLRDRLDGLAIEGAQSTVVNPPETQSGACDQACVLTAANVAVAHYAIQIRVSALGDGHQMSIFLFDVRTGHLLYTLSNAVTTPAGLSESLNLLTDGTGEALRMAIRIHRNTHGKPGGMVPSFTKMSPPAAPPVKKVSSATVRFESSPSGARIHVNGAPLASRTPTTASYEVGTELSIRMEHPDHPEAFNQTVDVQPGLQTVHLSFEYAETAPPTATEPQPSSPPPQRLTPLNTNDWQPTVTYRRLSRTSRITREFNCGQGEFADDFANPCPRAPAQGVVLNVKELDVELTETTVVSRLQSPYVSGFSAHIEVPVVTSRQQSLEFAGNGGDRNAVVITPENSTIYPANGAALFYVPVETPERSGLGDVQLGGEYALALPGTRPGESSRLSLTVDVVVPTADGMTPGGQEVGRDVFETAMGLSAAKTVPAAGSKPGYRVDFSAQYVLVTVPTDSIYQDYRGQQEHIGPGNRYGFDLYSAVGLSMSSTETLYIGAGVHGTLHTAGRETSTVFDALGMSNTPCPDGSIGSDARGLPNQACLNPDSASAAAGTAHDGLTVVEDYLRYGASLGADLALGTRFAIGIRGQWEWETNHFITGASPGQDLDGSGMVESRGQPNYNPAEHNPTYAPAIDRSGRRLQSRDVEMFRTSILLRAFL